MVMPATTVGSRVTLVEYLTFEHAAEEKHILWDGEIFPMWGMAGGSPSHNGVSVNIVGLLFGQFRGLPRRVFNSDQKVWVPLKGGVVYPDATVVCGSLALHDGTTDVIDNPIAIIEVLSLGTESFDRAEKFAGYRTIPSLRHYLMVSSTAAHVEHYERVQHDAWTFREFRAGDTVVLQQPDATLRIDDVYDRVFDAVG